MRWDALQVLNHRLDSLNRIRILHLESDFLVGRGHNEDMHRALDGCRSWDRCRWGDVEEPPVATFWHRPSFIRIINLTRWHIRSQRSPLLLVCSSALRLVH